jgi:DNA repair exonuclease SbcCD ATPase subunit
MKKKITIEQIYNIFQKYGDLNINVNTPFGYKKIEACDITAKNSDVIKIQTKSGKTLKCSPNHLLKQENKFQKVSEFNIGDFIETDSGSEELEVIELLKNKEDLYDIQVAEVKQYYSNGIVSHNSTFFNALYYSIYGESLNDTPEYDLIHHKKESMHLEVIINVGGKKYHIIRDVRKKSDIKRTTEYDVEINNLTDPSDTSCKGNKNEIKKFIETTFGSYKDFRDTALSKQFDIQSVVCSTPTIRAKILIKMLGLEIFEGLLKFITPRYNEMKNKLKTFNKDNVLADFSTIQDTIRKDTLKLEDINTELSELDDKITVETDKLIEIQKLIKEVKVEEINVDDEKHNITLYEQEIKNKEAEIQLIQLNPHNPEDMPKIQENIKVLKNAIADIDTKIRNLTTEKHNAERSIQVNKSKIKENKNDSQIIDKQPWCRETDLCKKCMFLEKAFEKERLIPGLERDIIAFEQYVRQKEDEIDEQQTDKKIIEDKIKEFEIRVNKDTEHKINQNRISLLKTQIEKIRLEIEKIKTKISDYEINQKTILENKLYKKQANEQELVVYNLKDQRIKKNNEANNLRVALKLNAEKVASIDKQIKEFELMEKEYMVYETYYHAVHRDGIPKSIVAHYIQLLNSTMTNMTKNVVDWNINAIMQDEELLFKVKEKSGLEYHVEKQASGMQVTIIGLAFRAALVLISRIAKCKILLLDEPLGPLDANMLGEIPKLFRYLKGLFKNVMVISHVTIYDICDNVLLINKSNGFSKIIQQ